MRILTCGFVMVLTFAFAGSAWASSNCYNIKSRDTKNMCLAKLKRQKSYCYNIKSRDQKNMCLSQF